MSRLLITVCVVTYNQEALIEKCLRSILDQVVDADVRVLVGDDASTDRTSIVICGLLGEYGDRLEYFKRNPNIGAFANMCDLLSNAVGDFFARVDGDDYWLPGKLQRQVDYLLAHPSSPAVYTNALVVDKYERNIGYFTDYSNDSIDIATLISRGNVLNNSSVLFRSSFKRSWTEVQQQIDFQVHLQMACFGPLGYIVEPFVAYRVGGAVSMVVGMNDRVRELYWQAMLSVPRSLVTDADWESGVADFLRRLFFRSLRIGNWGGFTYWVGRVRHDDRISWSKVALSIVRIGLKTVAGSFRSGAGKTLYPH